MSAVRIDYAAEAQANLGVVGGVIADAGTMKVSLADTLSIAQLQATLALVEQQRIANRIALAALVAETERYYGVNGSRAHLVGHEASVYSNPADPDGRCPLHDDIREGLGLGS